VGNELNLAMEPEETTILENVLSLVQQLLSMQGGQTEEMPPEIVEEAMPPENETMKAMEKETGDDKAETRLNNQTDVTDESMTDLKKNIAQLYTLLEKKRNVTKSMNNDPVLRELQKMNQTLQTVIQTQRGQDEFNHELMKAVGIADDMVAKTLQSTSTPTNTNKPIQGQDMKLFAQELVTQVFKNLPQAQTQNIDNHPFNRKRYDQQGPMNNVIDFVCKANNQRRVG